jgi:hypothetical protein
VGGGVHGRSPLDGVESLATIPYSRVQKQRLEVIALKPILLARDNIMLGAYSSNGGRHTSRYDSEIEVMGIPPENASYISVQRLGWNTR